MTGENKNGPPQGTPYKRKLSNFLLDAKFQLKFAAYFVALTLIVCAMLGWFLWDTTRSLFDQMNSAVDARSQAAETSRELGICSLNNDLTKNMDDPDFAAKLEERSRAIDAAFEAERRATVEAKTDLVKQQQRALMGLVGGLLAFILAIAFGAIVLTHRIVGPLFRIKRMAREVAGGQVRPPTYGLRPGDELQDVFEVFADMVKQLRARTEEDHAMAKAAKAGDKDAVEKLEQVLQERLDR